MKTKKDSALAFDLFFCLVFMPLIIVLGPAWYWITSWPLFCVLVFGFFYACYFVITRIHVPDMLLAKNYRLIAWVFGVLVIVNYLLSWYPLPQMEFVTPAMSEYQTQVRDYSVSLSLWMMFSLVLGYSVTTSLVKGLYEQLLLKRRIENERDKAELAMFRAQISPHFMFNTLNTLYSLVIGTSQKAEDAFIKFTEILKYTYVTIENEKVALDDEVAYIQNYIDLHNIRLNSHTRVDWRHDIEDGKVMIPPMIFLTFVENAFKYGASTSRDCMVEISLSVHKGVLLFETRNRLMKHADEFRTEEPVGIENCRARLSALYPGRFSLDTEEKDGVYHVALRISLKR